MPVEDTRLCVKANHLGEPPWKDGISLDADLHYRAEAKGKGAKRDEIYCRPCCQFSMPSLRYSGRRALDSQQHQYTSGYESDADSVPKLYHSS